MKIRCIIVDDEVLARKYLKDYITKIPFLDLVGDFNSPLKAYELLEKGEVDLMFLDIQMPEISGLDFLRSLNNTPHVILTTAYKKYALEGYEFNVVDYLLKPISFQRFLKAVNKVQSIVLESKDVDLSQKTIDVKLTSKIDDGFIIIKADRKNYKINFQDVNYIEGQKAYVTFHCEGDRKITALYSLKDLEQQLPKTDFIRVHKSYIVSVSSVTAFQAHQIELKGKQIPIGKNYKGAIYEFFETQD